MQVLWKLARRPREYSLDALFTPFCDSGAMESVSRYYVQRALENIMLLRRYSKLFPVQTDLATTLSPQAMPISPFALWQSPPPS